MSDDVQVKFGADPVLHIRHVGFGWLHFILGHDQARKLGQELIAAADAMPPVTAGEA